MSSEDGEPPLVGSGDIVRLPDPCEAKAREMVSQALCAKMFSHTPFTPELIGMEVSQASRLVCAKTVLAKLRLRSLRC